MSNEEVGVMRQPKGRVFCCGWWSPWCWVDETLHRLHIPIEWICARHDEALSKAMNKRWPDDDA